MSTNPMIKKLYCYIPTSKFERLLYIIRHEAKKSNKTVNLGTVLVSLIDNYIDAHKELK